MVNLTFTEVPFLGTKGALYTLLFTSYLHVLTSELNFSSDSYPLFSPPYNSPPSACPAASPWPMASLPPALSAPMSVHADAPAPAGLPTQPFCFKVTLRLSSCVKTSLGVWYCRLAAGPGGHSRTVLKNSFVLVQFWGIRKREAAAPHGPPSSLPLVNTRGNGAVSQVSA